LYAIGYPFSKKITGRSCRQNGLGAQAIQPVEKAGKLNFCQKRAGLTMGVLSGAGMSVWIWKVTKNITYFLKKCFHRP
jgi:hypothetical protein